MGAEQYVLVVDDDLHARSILCTIMATLEIATEEAANGEVAIAHIDRKLPALIFLDLMMPQMNGFEVLFYLRSNPQARNIPVIVVSAYIGDLELSQLEGLNIIEKSNFRAKNVLQSTAALLGTANPAVEETQFTALGMAGEQGFPQSAVAITSAERDQLVHEAIRDSLTRRELDVLRSLATGLTNQEIALELFVSVNTIKTHVSSILSKLNVSNRTQAINHARSLGLIDS